MDVKKNVTLEVCLADTAKAAFMEHCRQRDRTASEAIRMFIDDQLEPIPVPRVRSQWRVALAWSVGLALGVGVAVPSLARPERCAAPSFVQLDRNHDGVLTPREVPPR